MRKWRNRVVPVLPLAVLASACGDLPTRPEPPPLALNTMRVKVSGSIEMDTVVASYGGFQPVMTGEGEGLRVFADPRGIPLAIHLPGQPTVGRMTLGRWDPERDHLREGGVLTADPWQFSTDALQTLLGLGRNPSISFGGAPAVVFGPYVSVSGGMVDIEAIDLPEPRDFSAVVPRGSIQGRILTRVVIDPRLLGPGEEFTADTLDLAIAFRVSLENWPDGRGALTFTEGDWAGTTLPLLVGQGANWRVMGDPDRWLVIGLWGEIPGTGKDVRVWFGTKLRDPGIGTIERMDPWDVVDIRGFEWTSHFLAAKIDGVFYGAFDGTIELDEFVHYSATMWGDARGRATARLGSWPDRDQEGTERMAFRLDFHVPVGYFNQYCGNSPSCEE